jgi:glyoxylase-like metal-dependent hydrolase (beta-lactamase superfamily II)
MAIYRTAIQNTCLLVVSIMAVACDAPAPALSVDNYSCDSVPRPENAKLTLSAAADDWYQVYESADGVYSIVEAFQIQETISHLIVGDERALLFDTGIGLLPLKPVIERITDLPVTVLNSHTHYDHVGGNWEFSSILAIDSDYTRANMAGLDDDKIGGDFVPEAFCKGVPDGVDISSFYTKPWKASRYVEDGEIIDLGGRQLEVLHVPGHTPDAVALLDAENRLLFTGDSWYDASLWLFARETNLDDYEASISRLVELEENADFILGAHNEARLDAGKLMILQGALLKLRSGDYSGETDAYGRLAFEIDDIKILTSQPALDGKQGDISLGGSGIDMWGN